MSRHLPFEDTAMASTHGSVPTHNKDGLGSQETVLQKFYRGSSVFVTGATGFMGKVLIEKLLRSCPGVDIVYMLVRSKKGKTVQERIDDLVSSPCFDRLRQERPGFRCQLVGLAGDISEAGLGLSEPDRRLVSRHVAVVFHVAATVRFDEQLNVAVKQNVRATREVLALCRTCEQLQAVVHVSTAYANCPYAHIEERFYAPPLDCDSAIEMVETISAEELIRQSSNLVGKWPNTYTFTKAIAEDVVRKHGQGLPIGVVRPAVVVCTASEPEAGWTDTQFGPDWVMVATYDGLLRILPGKVEGKSGIVPCDMAINAIIASAWDIARNRLESSEVLIYNFTPSSSNSITWGNFSSNFLYHMNKTPSSRAFWSTDLTFVSNDALLFAHRLVFHFVPAAIGDFALLFTGSKPKLFRLCKRVHRMTDIYHFFLNRQWTFQEKNLPNMWAKLEEKDKVLFNFDMRSVDWDLFCRNSSPGLLKYLAKLDPANIPAARIRKQRLKVIKSVVGTVLQLVALFVIVPKVFTFTKHVVVSLLQLLPPMPFPDLQQGVKDQLAIAVNFFKPS